MKTFSTELLGLVLVAILGFQSSALASQTVVTEANANNVWTLPTGTNLLSGATFSPASSPANTGTGEGASTSWAILSDGNLGANADKTVSVTPSDGVSVTFTLNTTANYNGYSLTSFDSYCAWPDTGRSQQDFTILYSTVTAPATFITLAVVANHSGNNATHTGITDTSGTLATNVGAIRFSFGSPTGQENGYVGYREFIVLGTPVAVSNVLTWTGNGGTAGNGSWDTTSATNNWQSTVGGTPAPFANGNAVNFDTNGTNTAITVQAAGVLPNSLTFTNGILTAYSFGGGPISTTSAGGFLSVVGTAVNVNSVLNLSGPVNVTSGNLTLTAANTFAAPLTVSGGTLVAKNNVALGTGALIVNGGTASFPTLAPVVASLAGTGGTVTLGTTAPSNSTLTVGDSTSTTYAGVIGQASGATGALTKTGTGTLTLSGTETYSGTTTISGGSLQLAASGALPSGGNVSVAGGSLSGVGTASGSITVNSNGHLAPGLNPVGNFGAIGTLTLGTVTLNANSNLDLDLGAPGTSDIVAVTGALTFPPTGKVNLNLSFGKGFGNGTYKLVTFGSAVNAFTSSTFTLGTTPANGGTYTLAMNGNEIDLTVAGASVSGGVVSSAALGAGDFDMSVGLSTAKNYLNAVNSGGAAVTINGVPFDASLTATPSGLGNFGSSYSVTGQSAFGTLGTNLVTGDLGTALADFCYNSPNVTMNVNGLNLGQTYIITLYNRSYESNGQRVQHVAASDGGTGDYDVDLGATAQGYGSVARYSFVASGASESLTFTPANTTNPVHLYAFSTEAVFNNTYTGGASASTATFTVGPPDGAGSNVVFPAQSVPTTFDVDVPLTVGHVEVDGTKPWTFTGAAAATFQTDVGGVSVLNVSSGSHTITAPIILNNDVAKLGGGTLNLPGNISGPGGLMVNAGILKLSGASNTYTGATVAKGAELLLTDPNALGTTSKVVASSGGVIELNGLTLAAPIPASLSGQGFGAGALTNSSATAVTYSGDISSPDSFTIGGVGDITLTGAITGTGTATATLVKVGNNTLTISGITDNTNLIIVVNSGTVILNKTSAPNVHAVSGAGGLVINSGGVVKISGTGSDQIGDTTSVVVNTGGTLDLNGFSESFDALSGGGIVTNSAAGTTSVVSVGANGGGDIFSGKIQNGAAGGGIVAFTKTGAGTQTFASAQTYTGPTVIAAGTLAMTSMNGPAAALHYTFDNSDATDSSGNNNNGTLIASPTFVNGILGNAISFNGSTQYVAVPYSASLGISGSYTVSLWVNVGTATQLNNPTLLSTRNNGEMVLDLQYSPASGGFHADIGSTTVWLTTAANTTALQLPANSWNMITYVVSPTGFTAYLNGTTQVGTGTFAGTPVLMATGELLTLGAQFEGGGAPTANSFLSGALDEVNVFNFAMTKTQVTALYNSVVSPVVQIPGTLPAGTDVSLTSSSSVFNTAGSSQTIGSLSGVSGSSVVLGSATLTVGGSNASTTFSGTISGAGGLVKTGTGALTLDSGNTYTGPTTVAAGSFAVSGFGSISSPATVNANGVFRGDGLVSQLAATGEIYPGTAVFNGHTLNANQILNVGGGNSVDLTNGKLGVLLAPGAAGGFVTRLSVGGGGVTLLNSTLSVAAEGAGGGTSYGSPGTQYTIISTGTPAIANSFKTLLGAVAGASPFFKVQYYTGGIGGTEVTDGGTAGGPLMAAGQIPTPADTVALTFLGGAVTPATLDAFAASPEGTGVLISWNSISEYQNAGFNVYRRVRNDLDADSGRANAAWTRVNPVLLAGRITNPEFKAYSVYDWVAPGSYEYKLESISLLGNHEAYSQLATATVDAHAAAEAITRDGVNAAVSSVAIAAETERGRAASAAFAQTAKVTEYALDIGGTLETSKHAGVSAVAQGAPKTRATARAIGIGGQGSAPGVGTALAARTGNLVSSAVVNPSVAARWFSAAPVQSSSSFAAAKVQYQSPGIVRIPQSMLPSGFDIRRLAIQREGSAVTALALTSDSLLLYGPGYADDYTDKDAFFLRNSGALTQCGPAGHVQGLFSSGQPVNVDSPATATVDYHDVYFDYTLRPYTFAPWFSRQYLTDGSTQTFFVDTPDASSSAGTLTLNVWSLTQAAGASPDHALQVLVNSHLAGEVSWSGGNQMMQLTIPVDSGVLIDGANQIEIITPELPGVPSQISFLHSLTTTYTRALNGSAPLTIQNTSGASQRYEVSRLPSADAWVVDARFPGRAALIPCESQAQADGSFKLRFDAPGGGTGQFLVVPGGQENLPVSVSKRSVKPVKNSSYLAVGPSQFGPNVQPLVALRSKEGLRAQFVDQEQIFDYYNYGRYSPAAIQKAVQATRPKYLLLVGRTTYDYRNYSGLNVDPLCPTFLVSTLFWAQATSDSSFGDLGRGYPEIAVGRLPVNDASDLSVAVRRIMDYQGLPASGIRVHAVADQADPATADFAADAAAIGQGAPDLGWQADYLGVTYQTAPEVTAAMTTAANGGADLILYVGHGNSVHLGAKLPEILDTSSVQNWTGNVVLLQATCTGNWIANNQQGFRSIAIQALVQPQGGISASLGTSTYMTAESGTQFMATLIHNANTPGTRWGDALMKTQQWAYQKSSESGFYADLSRTEQILGDPAMHVLEKGTGRPTPGTPAPGSTPPPMQSGQF